MNTQHTETDETARNNRPASLTELAQLPAIPLADFALWLGLPLRTLLELIEEFPARVFLLGRRRYIRREDALEWIDQMAERQPWTRRRNNPRAGSRSAA